MKTMDLVELKLTEKRQLICQKLSLKNSDDILRYYPFKYEQYSFTHYQDFVIGERVVFDGVLISYPSTFRFRANMSRTTFRVLFEEEEITVTIFNRPWIRGIGNDKKVVIVGKYEGNNKVTASAYYTKDLKEVIGITPIYALKEGIKQNEIKKLIEVTINKCLATLEDEVPKDLIESHGLIGLKEALLAIHFPKSSFELKKALARLKYDEFLRFYLTLEILKDSSLGLKTKKHYNQNKLKSFIDLLPFNLTPDQEECVNDILRDLSSDKPMYRLVQGEVGSGKTAVAMIALYANKLAGYQGAIMAPTEILAKQHYESFKVTLGSNARIGLLYSGMNNAKEVKEQIKKGECDIVIGTHALFSEDVSFKNLGMVIADEQHRFGVKQRRALKEKGENVDFILMSATPIPRTLASSLYGDMDISSIATLPSGRKGCTTKLIKENSLKAILPELKEKLAEGRQIYMIASAIEASDNFSGKDASALYRSLIKVFEPYKLALLHGRLCSDEKDAIMRKFNNNEVQVLVSTTVVEVGVNVKNATTMVIYDADRFGLSQIHQLRGRVQRGEYKGNCYLLTDSKEKETLERLDVLVKNNDGFKIAEADLKLRGPGDILGTRQSGLPTFVLGNIFEDTKIIEGAKRDCKLISSKLTNKEYASFYQKLANMATTTYGD